MLNMPLSLIYANLLASHKLVFTDHYNMVNYNLLVDAVKGAYN